MPSKKLTLSLISQLLPKSKEYAIYDNELAGFFIRVTPTGKKVFYLWYRTREGRARKYRIGDFGVFTPQQARQRAKELAFAVASGNDPAGELSAAKTSPSVTDLATRYIEWISAHRKAVTAREYVRIINRHILPRFGLEKLSELKRVQVDIFHQQLASTPYEANRMLAVFSSMLSKAIGWEMMQRGSNFCADIEHFKERRRGTVLGPAELRRLWEAIRDTVGGPSDIVSGQIILLLLFTGCRKGEIRLLKGPMVDLEHRVIRFPDTKTGARTHVLGNAAVALLSTMNLTNGFVFPASYDPDVAVSDTVLAKYWARLRKRAELDELRIHDLRHNRGSWGAKNQLGAFTLQKMLGHSNLTTSERYLHAFDEVLAEANDLVDAELERAMGIGRLSDASLSSKRTA